MLLLDACFILCLFDLLPYEALGYDTDTEPVISKVYMFTGIANDMVLLENQIPLFILNKIYEVLVKCPHDNKVIDMMLKRFDSALLIGRELTPNEGALSALDLQNYGNNMLSCLEVFWHNLMYDSATKQYTTKAAQERIVLRDIVDVKPLVIPSVTALKEAGVVLKHKNTTPFWDIEFNAGVLEIPQIMIYEWSESIFLNLLVFELCHIEGMNYKITSYVAFMDSLVNSANDVAELRTQGIIVCAGPSDEEVADLFNRLGKLITWPLDQLIPFDQFSDLSRQIYEYCNRRSHRWRANLIHNYFNSPWTIISVIAAAVLMILTILQTVYTIGQYYEK